MSQLVDFYLGESTDSEGRWIEEVWGWGDDRLEFVHDYIQWLFPLMEPSNFNPDAPLLTPEDIQEFRKDKLLQRNVLHSFIVFAGFLGLHLKEGKVEKAPWFDQRLVLWKHNNHNWWRITRVITSLGLLGLEGTADAFFQCLKKLHEEEGYVSDHSFGFWREAWFNTTKSQPPC
jgi:hypothetical protein